MSPHIHLVTVLDVRQIRFGQSGSFTCGGVFGGNTLYEPASKNTQTTARFGLQF
ncbi:MAG: hypothetical protein ACYCOR_09785 [Acidobacteriaceae bacterium]